MEEKQDHKIYKYTNKVNGKVYIGRTCNSLKRRAKKNGIGYKKCPYFYKAIQKYGWNKFEGEIIEENLTADEAAEREIFYIKKYNSSSKENGYNIINDTFTNYSDNHREKISNSVKGKEMSEETKSKISEALKGRKLPKEVCEKMSQSRKGKARSRETIEKVRKTNLGRKLSEEHKKKLSEAKKGKYKGEESPNWGRKRSEEFKQKLREVNLGKTISEDARKIISEKLSGVTPWNKGKKMSREFCDRMRKRRPYNAKKIVCVETKVEYESIKKASLETGIGMKNISYALNKGAKASAGGFHWRYVSNTGKTKTGRPVTCVETQVEYYCVAEASRRTGIKRTNIFAALRYGYAAGGYHWQYIDLDEEED